MNSIPPRSLVVIVLVIVGAGIAVAVGLPAAYLLLFAVCPLMMVFMMRGMGSMNGQPSSQQPSELSSEPDPEATHDS